jgi:hypothetical protein
MGAARKFRAEICELAQWQDLEHQEIFDMELRTGIFASDVLRPEDMNVIRRSPDQDVKVRAFCIGQSSCSTVTTALSPAAPSRCSRSRS